MTIENIDRFAPTPPSGDDDRPLPAPICMHCAFSGVEAGWLKDPTNPANLVPCVCTRERRQREDYESRLLRSGLTTERRSGYLFTLWEHDGPRTLPNPNFAFDVAVEYAKDPEAQPWVYLWGANGAGKSMLGGSIGHHLLKEGREVFYVRAKDMLDELRVLNLTDPLKWLDRSHEIANIPVLIIDDFGHRWSDAIAEAYDGITDVRYDRKLPTVFTSNMNPRDVRERDARLHARLYEKGFCQLVEMRKVR